MVMAASEASVFTTDNVATKYEHSVCTMFGLTLLFVGFLDYAGSICHNHLSLR